MKKTARHQRTSSSKLLCILVVSALVSQGFCDVSQQSRQLQQYESTVQVIDDEGNYVGDVTMDYEPIQGHKLESQDLDGALQAEVIQAEASEGRCRRFHARAIPMFDSPAAASDIVSSVMVPVEGKLLSASVTMNLTHAKAGSAGVKLFYGNSPTDRPHLVLKDPCGPSDRHCDHFGSDMVNVLFSDEAEASFPQDEMEAPFTGEYKPVQPLSITKVGNDVTAAAGGTFGRWTLESHIPGDDKAPEMEWTLQLCYIPAEGSVEGVLDEMDMGPNAVLDTRAQQRGALAASFVRRMTAPIRNVGSGLRAAGAGLASRVGAAGQGIASRVGGRVQSRIDRIPGPVRAFIGHMGGMYAELAACYGIGEAYRIMELWYCNTFGGPIFLGIQFVTDPTCPTDLPALSEWLIPILEGIGSY